MVSISGRWFALSFPALLTGAALAAPAEGQGFGLNEIGTCAVARGFSVTGAPCADGSEIYWNPAAATIQKENTLGLGGALIAVSGGFREDTTLRRYPTDLKPEFAPHFFYNHKLNARSALGIGVYVPYGLTSRWHDDFPGRFSALKASLQTIYIQPNFAYAVTPEWSIGGGPVIGTSKVELIQSVDLSPQLVPGGGGATFGQLGIAANTEFARANVKGSAQAIGFNVGIFGTIAKNWTVGARYLSSLKFKYDDADARFAQIATGLTLAQDNPFGAPAGTPLDALLAAQFSSATTPPGALTPQQAKTEITHPWQAEVGIGYKGFEGTTLSASTARLGWSDFETLPITFMGPASSSNRVLIEDFQDIWVYRVGVEHTVMAENSFVSGVTFRGGFSYAETPAPDVTVTPLLPDMPRRNGSVGVGVPLPLGILPFGTSTQLDLSYLFVSTSGRRGRIVERTSAAQTASQLNTGAYDLKANVFSLSLVTHF